ncbi:MAG: hypothetical protein E7174_00840 [Firmicutes bacterium]|nr:hypothetical protein [Bacillota bacterium]
MIIGIDKKEVQKQRELKYNEYATLLNSNNPSSDELNALKSELKYLDDQLNKITGLNEKKRTEQVKNRKFGIEEKNKNSYYAFKEKYKKISNMKLATTRIIGVLNELQKQEYIEEKVMKKVA